ncbi:hypothetical protein [Actinoplanes regularis]|uniref:Uncharacterized protein n=1 Tax=Actinoplanes regularis TaxID=52697 RepID=A0A239BD00_9ACTN|nr:hypothetical protein [Actinoplanes regularis]SNS05288.1 hypothetical protein SAMN06264365_109101 [Actinoplanes regularis]
MTTPTRHPLGAMFALLTGLLWLAVRTTPGLALITLGSFAGVVGYPWRGLAAVALGALIYAAQCSRTPYTRCPRCTGTGRHPRRRTRTCRPCRGKGVRMRWGRRVMNAYRRATYTGTAPDARPARPLNPGAYADTDRH